MSGTRINEIVDYTAMVCGSIAGVKSVSGSGSGLYEDPLRPGQMVAACAINNVEAFAHWSDIPSSPMIEWVSQSGTVEMSWTIPMRLWLPKDDFEARRAALAFYDGYLGAFVADFRLGDLALRTAITRFSISGNPDWSWLDIGLLVVERVSYP